MSALDDLIKQIPDENLRGRIQKEAARLQERKRFGLIYENHLPECTLLYGHKLRPGGHATKKDGSTNELYEILSIEGDIASCRLEKLDKAMLIPVRELVAAARFGDPIYPCLQPLDFIENAPESALWQILIEADNYHALQLLDYLYRGKVDCIYIDPPYNTGAKDWKYNNNYVDASDAYRHSKWLSMMEKRLKLAGKLLNPDKGVLIITIDEHEIHHLRTLLEQLFPNYYIQMVIDIINPKGVAQDRFSRVEEYIIFCFAPNAIVEKSDNNYLNPPKLRESPRWASLLRSGTDSYRTNVEKGFYPILIDPKINRIITAKDYLPLPEVPDIEEKIDGYRVAWPIRSDGQFGRWTLSKKEFLNRLSKGYVFCGNYDPKRKTFPISYLSNNILKLLNEGKVEITGRDKITGSVSVNFVDNENNIIKTVWHRSLHDAGAYGTSLVSNILGKKRLFSYPKSLYATKDTLATILKNNKNAIIIDFFAGSGTTLHAVNLLNAEDGGQRRCILVTNNEVSEEEETRLRRDGFCPDDPEWEAQGIARFVTWPRTVNSIRGRRENGEALEGQYLGSRLVEKPGKRHFFQIPWPTTLAPFGTRQKKKLVAILGKDKIPQSAVVDNPDYIANREYSAAILFNSSKREEFIEKLQEGERIADIYLVTDNDSLFKEKKMKLLKDWEEFRYQSH